MLSDKNSGNYYYIGDNPLNMTKFDTKEDFGFYHTILWLQKEFLKIEEKIQKPLSNATESQKKKSTHYTIAFRDRSIVLSYGSNTSKESFDKIGKELQRHELLITRRKSPSLFPTIHSILDDLGKDISDAKTSKERFNELKSHLNSGFIHIHIVGEQRKVNIATAFIGATFQFINNGNPYIPNNITTHFIDVKKVGYDMDLDFRHNFCVDRIIHTWKQVNEWNQNSIGQLKIESKLLKKIQEYARQPLRIAIIGRTNAGKSVFINSLLGRDILPTHATVTTGCAMELVYANSFEEEKAEIHFENESGFKRIIYQLDNQLELCKEEIIQEESTSQGHWISEERWADMLSTRDSYENEIRSLQEEYEDINMNYPNGIMKKEFSDSQSYQKRDKLIREFLNQSAVNISPTRSQLINTTKIFIHHPLLKKVTLYDTPGLGEDSTNTRDSRTKQVLCGCNVNGWIYLVSHLQIERSISDDIAIVEKWSPSGLVCITKFDSALTGINDLPMDEILHYKRKKLKDYLQQRNFPAVSVLALHQVSQYNRHTKNIVENRLDQLIKSHVGNYLFSPLNDYNDEYSEDDYDDNNLNDDENNLQLTKEQSFTSYLKLLHSTNSSSSYRTCLRDSALEASLLMSLLTMVYDRIDSDFIVKRFKNILTKLQSHLVGRLNLVSERLNRIAKETQHQHHELNQSEDLRFSGVRELNTIHEQQSSLEYIEKLLVDNQKVLVDAMSTKKRDLYNQISNDFENALNNRRGRTQRIRDKIRRRNVDPVKTSCSIYEEFDKQFIDYVLHYIFDKLVSPIVLEELLGSFPELKLTILSSIDGMVGNTSLLNYTDKEIQYRNSRFLEDMKNTINDHFILLKRRVEEYYCNLIQMITGFIKQYIAERKTLLIEKKQNSTMLYGEQPICLLLTKLDILSSEFIHLFSLYSSVNLMACQNTIQANRSRKIARQSGEVRSSLTEEEKSYVNIIIKKMYENIPKHFRRIKNIETPIDSKLSSKYLALYIHNKFSLNFEICSIEDIIKYRPEKFIIRKNGILTVYRFISDKEINVYDSNGCMRRTLYYIEEMMEARPTIFTEKKYLKK